MKVHSSRNLSPRIYACACTFVFTMMNSNRFELLQLERKIASDEKLQYSLSSYFIVAVIFINQSFFQSPIIGLPAALVYVSINAVFLGRVFFSSQEPFFRLILGSLAFLMLLGFVSWVVLAIYSLNEVGSVLVLLIAATFSSIINRRMKHSNG